MIAPPWRARTVLTTLATACALLAPAPAGARPADPGPAPQLPALSAAAAASAQLAEVRGVALAPAVLSELDTVGVGDFWVGFAGRAELTAASRIAGWETRGRFVHHRLLATAEASQTALATRLRAAGVAYESYWIANTMLVRGADQRVLDGVLRQAGVTEVRADDPVVLPDPVRPEPAGVRIAAVEWGIADIGADQVWSQFGVRGDGIVVGSIDTGVAYTHPALVNQYRGNLGAGVFAHDYHWWDPSHVCPNPEPCDNNNHGTHVTGTMVGDDGAGNQVGVAPGAQWIAAKGCEFNTCSEAALLSAGQFMLAPTNLAGGDPRPELRPHVVNNSWSGPGGQSWFDPVVDAWVAAGIFPAFANGNAGPGCGTAGSPGDGPQAYAAGAYGSDHQIAGFSSRGPGRDGQVKPDLAAPGVSVRSAVPAGYGVASGTSMASPHLAGTVALMWSASGEIGDIPATRAALDATATDTDDLSCGGEPGDNNVYGQGRLDALAATTELAIDSGITGVVTDAATGQPLAGVTVDGAGRQHRTDEQGRYTVRVVPGSHTVEFSRFGYLPATIPVEVPESTFVTVDVPLARAPLGGIAGTVTDEASGHTIPGVTVRVLDVPVELAAVTGADGQFTIPDVPAGTYQVQVSTSRPGVWAPVDPIEVSVTGDQTAQVDVALPPAGDITRVSIASDGTESNDSSGDGVRAAAMSADGRYVAFHSRATNLVDVPVPAGGGYQVYLHDRHTGATELVSVSHEGRAANGNAWKPTISADGRHVAFYSGSSNLVADPPPSGAAGIYLRDRVAGTTELLAADVPDFPNVESPAITPDGRQIAFQSGTDFLDPSGVAPPPLPVCGRDPEHPVWSQLCAQIFVVDRHTGLTEPVSVSSDGEPGHSGAITPVLSADGRYVAFRSRATNLVDEPTNIEDDIFVHDRQTGQTEWVSVLESSGGLFGGITSPVISDDGRFVAYQRGLDLAALFDRTTGQTELLTVPVTGDPPAVAISLGPVIGDDGRSVAFTHIGFEDLLVNPIPEATGLFVRDLTTGAVEPVISNFDVAFTLNPWAVSGDGRRVLISSDSTTLVPGVTNGVEDVYLVDREHDQALPDARFAVWGLTVEPAAPQPGQPVELTVNVKNVDEATGQYQAVPLVDSGAATGAAGTVTLDPGETTTVSVTVTVTEGGTHPVRVGQAGGELRVQSGSVAGTVTDANDGQALEGAVVTAVNGTSRRTATTFSDGTFALTDLQLGSWTVTVEAGGYRTGTQTLAVTGDGQRLVHEVALATGVGTAAPDGFTLTTTASAGARVAVAVGNQGSAELDWGGGGWSATTTEQPSILLYAHETARPGPDSHADRALRRLGLEYTGFYGRTCPIFQEPDTDLPEFAEALASGHWDLVVVSANCTVASMPQETLSALRDYVEAGGRLVMSSWQIWGSLSRQHPLWESLGVRFVSRIEQRPPSGLVHWWEPDHRLFTGPLPVPDRVDAPGFSTRVDPLPGSVPLAGYTTTAGVPQMATLVSANDGRTLFRGFSDVSGATDADRDGVPDDVALWVNSVAQVGRLSVQPWLTASGASVLAPGGGAELPVTVDSGGLAPGTYQTTVAVVTDAARVPQLTVPVTVTVVGCDRTVTGTHLGPLVVTGGVTCLAEGARQIGPVTVRPGAGLIATGATMTGPVVATGAAVVELRHTRLIGPVTLTGGTGLVSLSGNQITGPVLVRNSHTGQTPVVVAGNQITGPLSCHGNQPAPVNHATPNTGSGPRTGQCAGL